MSSRKDKYIKILGILSETKEHEKIEDCLRHYDASGTINLTERQLREYGIKILQEEEDGMV